MNKQEENISDIITLEAIEEIVDIFLEHVSDTEDTVGIIANKELIKYAMGEVLSNDWISVRKVDLELDNDIEYMISIDSDGDLVVQPVIEYKDKYFADMQHVYISMDGDVDQTTIDNCLNRDIDVALFGYEDEPDDEENCTINGKSATKEEFDKYVSQFRKTDNKAKNSDKLSSTPTTTYRVNGKQVDKVTYDKAVSEIEDKYLDNMRDMLLGYCEFMDEINEWRKLFRW